jgi:hypothetical protein
MVYALPRKFNAREEGCNRDIGGAGAGETAFSEKLLGGSWRVFIRVWQ